MLGTSLDPVGTDPDHYSVVFENDKVPVLRYTDRPGDRTTPHEHPDSVMVALSGFRRRLHGGDGHRDVELPAGGCPPSGTPARTSGTRPPRRSSSS